MKKCKKLLALILTVATMFSLLAVNASAAGTTKKLPSLSSSKYIQCYTLKSSGTVQAYTNSSLNTKKKGYTITCKTDECRIVAVSGNAVKVSYPLDQGGRSTQWFKRSDFTATNISGNLNVKRTTAKITTYRRADGNNSYGYAGKGDDIYVLGTSGSYTQIIYELSNGNWKMGWIKTSDANKYLTNTGSSNGSSNTTNADKWQQSTVKVTKAGQVVDTFNGVSAVYTPADNAIGDTTYCCAAYVKKYYSSVYGVDVWNLNKNCTPQASSGSFKVTNSPQVGDIGYEPGHWFIIKAVNSDGTYTVIEQNKKWKKNGTVMTYLNRHVSYSSSSGFQVFRWSGK